MAATQTTTSTGHEFSLCQATEVASLTGFIDQHWKKGHILATSRTLLDWQHLDRTRGRYNFVLARSETGQIDAVLGFITPGQFDSALEHQPDVWTAIWKVREGVQAPALGLRLIEYLAET